MDSININEIKEHLEKEVDYIFNNTNNPEIEKALERIRQSYYIYYRLLKRSEN